MIELPNDSTKIEDLDDNALENLKSKVFSTLDELHHNYIELKRLDGFCYDLFLNIIQMNIITNAYRTFFNRMDDVVSKIDVFWLISENAMLEYGLKNIEESDLDMISSNFQSISSQNKRLNNMLDRQKILLLFQQEFLDTKDPSTNDYVVIVQKELDSIAPEISKIQDEIKSQIENLENAGSIVKKILLKLFQIN